MQFEENRNNIFCFHREAILDNETTQKNLRSMTDRFEHVIEKKSVHLCDLTNHKEWSGK